MNFALILERILPDDIAFMENLGPGLILQDLNLPLCDQEKSVVEISFGLDWEIFHVKFLESDDTGQHINLPLRHPRKLILSLLLLLRNKPSLEHILRDILLFDEISVNIARDGKKLAPVARRDCDLPLD